MSPRPPLHRPSEIAELADRLRSESVIAFDTEFIRESTFYPQLEILQVATAQETWLVDVPAFKKDRRRMVPEGLMPLMEVLADPGILKVVHASQADQECLFTSFGVLAQPVLDTEVAGSLSGYGDGVGLGNLLKAVLGVTLKKGHARTDWSVRPLPPQQLEYAHLDVHYLVEMGSKLLAELDGLGRKDWALKLSSKWTDPYLLEPTPEQIAERLARGGKVDKRGYSVLIELVKWRERRVRDINVPRRWVAEDSILVDLAQVRPKDMGHLSSFRGLNRGEMKNSGPTLLGIIQQASQHEVERPSVGKRMEPPDAEEARALDLLKCYVGILADRHQVASKHLMLADQTLRLLRADLQTADDLAALGLLSPEAVQLIGEELVALLRGQRALSIQKDRVQVVEVKGEKKHEGKDGSH